MKKVGLLVFIVLSFAQVSCTTEDYSKMSANELNEALIVAVKKGSFEEVKKLVQAGADVNQKITYTESGYDYDADVTCTPLEYAAKHGYIAIAKALLQAKISHGFIDSIREFLGLKAKDEDISKALIIAAKKGYAGVTREILQAKPTTDALNKALITAADNFPGITADTTTGYLYRTTLDKGYLNIIKALIKAGAYVNYTDESGSTALISVVERYLYTEAQKKARAEVIQTLLEAKANVNHEDNAGNTALIQAIKKHALDAVQTLLKAQKIDVNYANKDGNTALIIALKYMETSYISGNKEQYNDCLNSQKIVKELLKTPGINPHHVNKKGETAIKLLKRYNG